MPNSFTPQQIEQFLQEFFDVVGARQYIGARYVPIFGRSGEDTVEWDDAAPYEPLTVVMHEGVSYVSRRYVPTGIQITDTDYWVQTYRFNAQVEEYRQEVLSFQDELENRVPFPDPDLYPRYGEVGQVLSTLSDGSTKWEDPVVPSDSQAEAVIDQWLTDHPEATTTVQDGSLTIAKFAQSALDRILHASGKFQQHASHDIDDAGEQPSNSVCFISANIVAGDIANLPEYGSNAILAKVNFSGNVEDGWLQLYASATSLWFREEHAEGGTPTFGSWHKVYPLENGSVSYNSLSQGALDALLHSSGKFQQPSNHDISDAADQPINSVCAIAANITQSHIANLPSYGSVAILAKVNFSRVQTGGFLQIYGSASELWYREGHTESSTLVIGDWHKVYPIANGAVTYDNLSQGALDALLHSSGKFQQHSSHNIDDANDQPGNSICFVGSNIVAGDIANLPEYGSNAVLAKFNFSRIQADGWLQIYASATSLWFREEHTEGGTPTFGQWRKVYPAVRSEEIQGSGNFNIQVSNMSSWPFSDADDQPRNTTYFVNSDVTESDFPNLPDYGNGGLLTKVNFSGTTNIGYYQVYVTRHAIWLRTTFGSVYEWRQIHPDKPITNDRTCNIFRKVVCVGDSYTAGYIQDTSAPAAITNEDYAWPHYMETITGNEYVNCGASGATTLNWPTNERGLPKAQQSGVSQAYIIGLMINDVNNGVPLGSIANVEDATPTTYYAGLGSIVRSLHTISPLSHIFIQTTPRETESFQPYNQAVRDVVQYYASTMNTHLLDLFEYRELYEDPSLTGDKVHGHYTAIGYQQFAEILARILSDYINGHISAFQHVYALPYD